MVWRILAGQACAGVGWARKARSEVSYRELASGSHGEGLCRVPKVVVCLGRGEHFGHLEGVSVMGEPRRIFKGLRLTCEDEGGGYRGPQHGVAAPVSLALQCRPD